jgi:hypothetical protein
MGPQKEGPMRRAVLVLIGLVSAAPALGQQPPQQFECFEEARACTNPNDVPSSCTVDIPDLQRQTPQQVILRDLQVAEGPFTGTALGMAARSAADDRRFAAARVQLCDATPTAPPAGPGSPTTGSSPGLVGGNPGLTGGNPGLTSGGTGLGGANPGLTGGPALRTGNPGLNAGSGLRTGNPGMTGGDPGVSNR